MRTFWRINYFLSFFHLFGLLAFLAQNYITNDWYYRFCDEMAINTYTLYISFYHDFLQFVICFFVLVFVKAQRTTWHFCYILILLLLIVFAVIFFLVVGGVYG